MLTPGSIVKKIFINLDALERPVSADVTGKSTGFPDLNMRRREFTMDRGRLGKGASTAKPEATSKCLTRAEMKQKSIEWQKQENQLRLQQQGGDGTMGERVELNGSAD